MCCLIKTCHFCSNTEEINTNSMTVKDSNFALEKNYNIKNKKNSINKYDYVM